MVLTIFLSTSFANVFGYDNTNMISNNNSSDEDSYAVIYVGRYFPRLDFNKSNWGGEGGWKNLETIQQYYTWYLTSASRIYKMLQDKYGYDDDHIFLIVQKLPDFIQVSIEEEGDTIKKTFFRIPDIFNPKWIDEEYSSDESGLETVLKQFKPNKENSLDDKDTLIVFYIDHGATKKDGTSYFGCPLNKVGDLFGYFSYLFNQINSSKINMGSKIVENTQKLFQLFGLGEDPEILEDREFADYVKGIKAKMIFALQPCHSGGFIKELSAKNRIVCTSSRIYELADSWIGPFIDALYGEEFKVDNQNINPDYNNDGLISINEAYKATAEFVDIKNFSQDPLIDDNGDGIGHHYSEEGYFENNETDCSNEIPPDGCLANQTFLNLIGADENDDAAKIKSDKSKFTKIAIESPILRFIKMFGERYSHVLDFLKTFFVNYQ